MDNLINWFRNNGNEITWFIIGWLSMAALDQLSREHYFMAAIDAGLAYFNYRMWKANNV